MDPEQVWILAASNGSVHDIFNLHLSDFQGYTPEVMDNAAKYGHLDIINILATYRTEGCTENAFYWACMYGQIEVLQTLFLYYPEKYNIKECIKIAKMYNQIDTLNALKKMSLDNKKKKCHTCFKKIGVKLAKLYNNSCRKCYYTQFPYMKPLKNCHYCNVEITAENSSSIQKRCINCLKEYKKNYKKMRKEKGITF